ncbi:MAG: carbohydrate binding family 9 domain-containing protein [Bryobacteraceae bacterium]|nr:carbohydrate binding family 9 domain-containing protein [Bryobacteraceae bacterium]
MPLSGRLCVLAVALVICPGAAWPQRAPREAPAYRVSEEIRIDGILSEAVWREAQPIGDLVQQEPRPGEEPGERTGVRIAYNADAIFIGVECQEALTGQLRATQTQRDGSLLHDDSIQLLLDTFHDRSNAYYFATNPAGVMVDGTISDNNAANLNWDGIWYVKTRVEPGRRWTAEFRIPFKTLAFNPRATAWGFNIARRIARLREESRWTSPNLDSEFFLVARAGDITGLEGMTQGIGLDFRPWALAGYSRDVTRDPVRDIPADGGVDIFYRITSNLVSSTSINTDFAETEVDTRQINLTRFPLLFPEKRTFFLEDSGIFEFAAGPGTRTFTPYFSRRIGLLNGEEVPILFGQKVTGRVGRYDVGIMDVQTRHSEIAPATNFFVGRLKRNFWSQSFVGGLFTSGEPTGTTSNQQLGVDMKIATANFFNTGKNFRSLLYVSKSRTPRLEGKDIFWGGEIVYPNDRYYLWYRRRRVGENYNPGLGFMPRTGALESATGSNFRPRPKFWNIRQVTFNLYYTSWYNLAHREIETRTYRTTPLKVEFNSGDSFTYEWTPTLERLFTPFEIRPGIRISPGSYWFHRHDFTVQTAQNRPLSLMVKTSAGSFYSGDSQEFSPGVVWRKSRHLTTSLELQQYWVKVREGHFRTRLALYRLDYSFNPYLSLANFAQYDTDTRNLGLQSRLRWTIRPGNDLFFVLNHAWQYQTLDRFERLEALLTNARVKLNYTFRF